MRSIDTYPAEYPSRLLRRPLSEADRFGKVATVVTKLYSDHLDTGTPLVAQTSWVRLVPTDMPGPAVFSDVAALGSLGMGEVHEVPYDPAVLGLADEQRRAAVLEWLQDHMLRLAGALGWEPQPLVEAYEACRRDGLVLRKRGPVKTSADRKRKAYAEFEIDGDGDGWTWAVVTDAAGTVEATSPRHDTPPTLTAAGKALKSLRWDGDAVTWTPWTDDIAPKGQPWVGHVERFTVA